MTSRVESFSDCMNLSVPSLWQVMEDGPCHSVAEMNWDGVQVDGDARAGEMSPTFRKSDTKKKYENCKMECLQLSIIYLLKSKE